MICKSIPGGGWDDEMGLRVGPRPGWRQPGSEKNARLGISPRLRDVVVPERSCELRGNNPNDNKRPRRNGRTCAAGILFPRIHVPDLPPPASCARPGVLPGDRDPSSPSQTGKLPTE